MKKRIALLGIATTLCLNLAWAEDDAEESPPPENPCISGNPTLSDSAFWSTTAVELFSKKQYAEAVATVDACFPQWGPTGGHQQKKLYDEGKKCPKTGAVSKKAKDKIDSNGLLNDVSLALWAKARSLHELDQIEPAKNAYTQCLYMKCGRAWDPNGWFWSPAEDCAVHVQELIE